MICSLIIEVVVAGSRMGTDRPAGDQQPGSYLTKSGHSSARFHFTARILRTEQEAKSSDGEKMADRTNFVSCSETGLNVEEEDVIFQHGGVRCLLQTPTGMCGKTPSALCSLRMSCWFLVNIDYDAAAITQR